MIYALPCRCLDWCRCLSKDIVLLEKQMRVMFEMHNFDHNGLLFSLMLLIPRVHTDWVCFGATRRKRWLSAVQMASSQACTCDALWLGARASVSDTKSLTYFYVDRHTHQFQWFTTRQQPAGKKKSYLSLNAPSLLDIHNTNLLLGQTLNPSSNAQECFVHGADGSLGGCLMQNGLFAPSLPPIEVNY